MNMSAYLEIEQALLKAAHGADWVGGGGTRGILQGRWRWLEKVRCW